MAGYSDSYLREKMLQRWTSLDTEYSSWRGQYQDISKYLMPTYGRFFATGRNKGDYKYGKIIDQTGTHALNVLSSGMMSGVTSPARPWFRLALPDLDLMQSEPVKQWLDYATTIMRDIFARSNTYRVFPGIYKELGGFGVASDVVEGNFNTIIHHNPLTQGQFRIGTNELGQVDTLYRRFDMTVHQLVKKFGLENVSRHVKTMYETKNWDAWVTVIHAIEPRDDRDTRKRDALNMPWRSVYFEEGYNPGDKYYLRESGYQMFRGLCPRWETVGEDVQGISPAMECLGDIKQLQHQQSRKGQAIDYQTRPPMQSNGQAKGQEYNMLPGGVTQYNDAMGPGQGLRPAFESNLRLDFMLSDIQDVRARIQRSFFADLFLMMANDTRSNITATEVAERHEEKLQMLGPVLERLHNEMLSPLIDITFSEMLERGVLPPAPEELQGQELKVEFVSVLAQAQKMVGLGSVDRLLGTIGSVSALRPEALDKLNVDVLVDKYSDLLGVDPDLIIANDQVALIRENRAEQQKQMQQMQQMQEMAGTAKTLSEAKMDEDSALTKTIDGLTGYN